MSPFSSPFDCYQTVRRIRPFIHAIHLPFSDLNATMQVVDEHAVTTTNDSGSVCTHGETILTWFEAAGVISQSSS